MMHMLIQLLFPERSLDGHAGTWITAQEFAQMRMTPRVIGQQELRAMGVMHLDRLVAAGTYDESPLLRTALHRFKYKSIRALGVPLARLFQSALPLMNGEGSVLCPVPLHWSRIFSRGFNQSEILARELSAMSGIPVRTLLRRRRATGHQARRHREERLRAVQNAFSVCAKHEGGPVILVDDIATTCATLDACAAALKKAGMPHVQACVLALG